MVCEEKSEQGTPIVLIVDDDAMIRETMGLILHHKGYGVATAENGEEALSYLGSRPPPVCVLCDLTMPVMGGMEFARRKNANPLLKAIPLVIVSGVVELVKDPGVLHAVALLSKPVDFGRLLPLIHSLCSF